MKLNPADAWKPFEPSPGEWNHAAVAHFFRRAGFGATAAQISDGLKSSPLQLARQLVQNRTDSADEIASFESLSKASVPTNNADTLAAAWLYRMLHTTDVLREKMTLFWHGHFATSNEKVQNTRLMLLQNQLLREHALGDFGKLVHGIAKDPAMLVYLDSQSNRKAHPNENFAREVMELFVLDEGNYAETDVRELARCFTGWELRRERFRFNRYQHDRGEKTVLGESGNLSGEQGIDVVLKQESGPDFIARKLVRYFVSDEPALAAAYIAPLAKQLRDDNWNVGPTVQTILSSRMFYSVTSVARKIRSPVEMAVGLLRSLEASCNVTGLGTRLREIGQGLYHPPNVKGWDGGRTWVNSSTLLGRANLVRELLSSDKTRFDGTTLAGLLKARKAGPGVESIAWFERMLLAIPLRDTVRDKIARLLDSAAGSPDQRLRKVVHAISIQPEFQLG